MSEFIQEPELTRIIQEIDTHGMDVVALLESTPEGVRWRPPYGGLTVDPMPTNPYVRGITDRDKDVLARGPEVYDYVQVVFSRLVARNDTYERDTYKTAHLPIEALKQHLRGKREGHN